jgi:hypothetical protein
MHPLASIFCVANNAREKTVDAVPVCIEQEHCWKRIKPYAADYRNLTARKNNSRLSLGCSPAKLGAVFAQSSRRQAQKAGG